MRKTFNVYEGNIFLEETNKMDNGKLAAGGNMLENLKWSQHAIWLDKDYLDMTRDMYFVWCPWLPNRSRFLFFFLSISLFDEIRDRSIPLSLKRKKENKMRL